MEINWTMNQYQLFYESRQFMICFVIFENAIYFQLLIKLQLSRSSS